MNKDYATVTETPGIGATREQLSMLYTRYKFALSLCIGKDVLEVACGAGQGLGYLSRSAKRVMGGDIDEINLSFAAERYRRNTNIALRKMDAQNLPVKNNSFDVILLYEAIYYLHDPGQFLKECLRVLRDNGLLVICTVNREWADFNPSPFSTQYFSAAELSDFLRNHNFNVEILAAFSVSKKSVKDSMVSTLKRSAVAMGILPKTMEGKQFLKRIFLGELSPLPSEVEDSMAEYIQPVPINPTAMNSQYKVLYAIARKT